MWSIRFVLAFLDFCICAAHRFNWQTHGITAGTESAVRPNQRRGVAGRRVTMRNSAPAMQIRKQTTTVTAESERTFEEKRDALKACLTREYRSFFRPFEPEFYSEDVTFRDPLNNLKGKASYEGNVQMLSGESIVGNFMFADGFIDLHGVEDIPGDPTQLRTRWTLGFAFKLLPWKPKAVFTGVSEYVIDPSSAIVLSQRDYWDTLSLSDGGSYVPEVGVGGITDLIAQWLPGPLKPAQGQEPKMASDANWSLLRRARMYRIYRGHDGLVFALQAPGMADDMKAVERELLRHGLSPGQQMQVNGSPAIQLLSPHPWDCNALA